MMPRYGPHCDQDDWLDLPRFTLWTYLMPRRIDFLLYSIHPVCQSTGVSANLGGRD